MNYAPYIVAPKQPVAGNGRHLVKQQIAEVEGKSVELQNFPCCNFRERDMFGVIFRGKNGSATILQIIIQEKERQDEKKSRCLFEAALINSIFGRGSIRP